MKRKIMEDYDKIKKVLALGFMRFLDENRTEGKMCLSNGECADIEKAFNEQDWSKLARYLDKYLIDGGSSEVPKDLEEAANKYATEWHENPDGSAWKPFFEVSAIKAFITGAEWQKKQMMKDAVEGTTICYNDETYSVVSCCFDNKEHHHRSGDKVRIIVLKAEEE